MRRSRNAIPLVSSSPPWSHKLNVYRHFLISSSPTVSHKIRWFHPFGERFGEQFISCLKFFIIHNQAALNPWKVMLSLS